MPEPVQVLKFGGSSFIELADYGRVATYLAARLTGPAVVVVSGMSGTTGHLLESARAIDPALAPEAQDHVLATAEMVSASFLRAALDAAGVPAVDLWAPQLGLRSDATATRAVITELDPGPVRAALAAGRVVVAAGGQAVSPAGRVTMLGRNSSDLTAVALAAALGAATCEIFSDVAGVYAADPYVVPAAGLLPRVSYAQCAAMAASGAKVLHPGAAAAAAAAGVTIACRNLPVVSVALPLPLPLPLPVRGKDFLDPVRGGDDSAVTGTLVGSGAGESAAVVGAGPLELVALADPGRAAEAVAVAAAAGVLAVTVPDGDGVVVAAPGPPAGLAELLGAAGLSGRSLRGLGLITEVSPSGHARRRLVPLAVLDDQVREQHARLAAAPAIRPAGGAAVAAGPPTPEASAPTKRRSAHSGLLTGGRR
jgi:aspartate kinase